MSEDPAFPLLFHPEGKPRERIYRLHDKKSSLLFIYYKKRYAIKWRETTRYFRGVEAMFIDIEKGVAKNTE